MSRRSSTDLCGGRLASSLTLPPFFLPRHLVRFLSNFDELGGGRIASVTSQDHLPHSY